MTDRTPRDHAAGESQQLSDVPPHETIRLRDMLIDELIAARKEIERLRREVTAAQDEHAGLVATTRESVKTLIKALATAHLKAAGTLANNLCPDHRDKQVGKPCLACEITRLAQALAEALAPTDTVPRSRYDACTQDWLAAENECTRIAGVAKEEIDRLTARVAELEKERDAWCGDAGAMQALLQRPAKRLAEPSTVPQVHHRCLHPSACREQHGYCPECHSSMYP